MVILTPSLVFYRALDIRSAERRDYMLFEIAVASGATLTADQLAPISSAVTDNAGVLLPVGIAIMAVMIGISLIPRIVYKFL